MFVKVFCRELNFARVFVQVAQSGRSCEAIASIHLEAVFVVSRIIGTVFCGSFISRTRDEGHDVASNGRQIIVLSSSYVDRNAFAVD